MTDIRPTVSDMTGNGKWQSLSLRDAGQFDKKFVTDPASGVQARLLTTAWQAVCIRRHAQGISRKARIRARKEAQ